jgi:hypothetical protein
LENTTHWDLRDSQRSGFKHCHRGDLGAMLSKITRNACAWEKKSRSVNAFGKVCVPDMNLVFMSVNGNLKTHSTKKSKSNPNLVVLKRADHPAHRAFSAQKEKSDSVPSQRPTQINNFLFLSCIISLLISQSSSFPEVHFTNLLDLPSWALLTVNNSSYTFGYQTPGFIYSIVCLVRY